MISMMSLSRVGFSLGRNREGLTQIKLARLTGISQHHITEMERGKRSISKNAARILSKALGADYQLLL